jgi:hypothetical protein
MKQLIYSKNKPTAPGMYWYAEELVDSPSIVRLFKDSAGLWSVQYDQLQLGETHDYDIEFDSGVDYVENYKGFFAGPIPAPKKPKSLDFVNLG